MRTYWTTQETLLNPQWCPEWEGNIKGRGYMADSFCCTVLVNITLWSNYTPIKSIKKKENRT